MKEQDYKILTQNEMFIEIYKMLCIMNEEEKYLVLKKCESILERV